MMVIRTNKSKEEEFHPKNLSPNKIMQTDLQLQLKANKVIFQFHKLINFNL